MWSAPTKPTIKIWGAACASQGPLDLADGAFRRICCAEAAIRFRSNPIAFFFVLAEGWLPK
jgi:hypothetical protein